MEIIAFGTRPDRPTAFSTTMIIGAMARMGMVWLVMIQGISDLSMARFSTIETASPMPRMVPMAKPSSVEDRVTPPWKISERFEVIFFSTVVFQISVTIWCGAGRIGRSCAIVSRTRSPICHSMPAFSYCSICQGEFR